MGHPHSACWPQRDTSTAACRPGCPACTSSRLRLGTSTTSENTRHVPRHMQRRTLRHGRPHSQITRKPPPLILGGHLRTTAIEARGQPRYRPKPGRRSAQDLDSSPPMRRLSRSRSCASARSFWERRVLPSLPTPSPLPQTSHADTRDWDSLPYRRDLRTSRSVSPAVPAGLQTAPVNWRIGCCRVWWLIWLDNYSVLGQTCLQCYKVSRYPFHSNDEQPRYVKYTMWKHVCPIMLIGCILSPLVY